MSRSKRKMPIMGFTTAQSEKADKAAWHRRDRRAAKLNIASEGQDYVDRSHRENSNPWSMAKDGRQYCPDAPPKSLRK